MIADEIVDMSCVGDRFVTAPVAVNMAGIVDPAFVGGCARRRILARARKFVLHHCSVVGVMQVAIV